jgi:hypothetical protein
MTASLLCLHSAPTRSLPAISPSRMTRENSPCRLDQSIVTCNFH